MQLAYNKRAIARHVNKTHKKRSFKMNCRWESPLEGPCKAKVDYRQLRRHVLDRHTTLLVVRCDDCGDKHREDVMDRHKRSCKGRRA